MKLHSDDQSQLLTPKGENNKPGRKCLWPNILVNVSDQQHTHNHQFSFFRNLPFCCAEYSSGRHSSFGFSIDLLLREVNMLELSDALPPVTKGWMVYQGQVNRLKKISSETPKYLHGNCDTYKCNSQPGLNSYFPRPGISDLSWKIALVMSSLCKTALPLSWLCSLCFIYCFVMQSISA